MSTLKSQSKAIEDAIDADWSALIGAVEQFPEADSYQRIMDIVCAGARELCQADGISFVLRDGDLCHYIDEDTLSPLWKGKRFPMSACISGWCMLNRETAVVPDIYKDPRIPHDVYRPTFVKTMVMVPVRVDDPIAAIGTYWAREHLPSTHTVMMLEALARSTATALVKAREFTEDFKVAARG